MGIKDEMNKIYNDFDEIGEFLEKKDLSISNALNRIKKVYIEKNREKAYNKNIKDKIKTKAEIALDRIEYFLDKF